MAKYILFSVIIFILVIGCGKKYKFKKYTDAKKMISINYPEQWIARDNFTNLNSEVPLVVAFTAPRKTGSDYIETVNLTFSAQENKYQDIKKKLQKYVEAFTLIGEEKFAINGKECNRIIYTGVQGEKFLSIDQIFYPVKKGLYVITYLSTPQTYEKYKKFFEDIAGSLVVAE